MTLSTGTRLGPYEISSPLGAGGMGEVTHDGAPYVVSELLLGDTLRQRIGAPLPLKRAVEYALQELTRQVPPSGRGARSREVRRRRLTLERESDRH